MSYRPGYPKPAVQTLAHTLAMTGARVSEALAIRACDVDLEANELRIATLKRRRSHWRVVPVPEDLVHALEFVHRLRRAQGSPRGRKTLLWPITRQTANRQVGAIMRGAGIEGPQACPRGLRQRPAPDDRRGARAADEKERRSGGQIRGRAGPRPRARERDAPHGAWPRGGGACRETAGRSYASARAARSGRNTAPAALGTIGTRDPGAIR